MTTKTKTKEVRAFTPDSWREFRQTLRFLHEPLTLPEFDRGAFSFAAHCREVTGDLLGRALAQNALPEEVVAVQLVTRRLDGRADHAYPLLVRDEPQLSAPARRSLVAAFAFMTCGLLQLNISTHRRLRQSGSLGSPLELGTMILYPELDAEVKGADMQCHGMHEISLSYSRPHPDYPADALAAFEEFAIEDTGAHLPRVRRYDIAADGHGRATALLPFVAAIAPPWKINLRAKQCTSPIEARTLKELANQIGEDEAYRALVAPLHRNGPLAVCAPKVYDVRQLKSASDDWVFDAGLTLMLSPGTRLLDNPLLCSRIMIVAEEVASQVAALSGLLPQAREASRRSIVRETFGLVSHSLGNAIATLETSDRQVWRTLQVEQLNIAAAAELNGEPTGQYQWPNATVCDPDFVETLRLGLIGPNARRRLQLPEHFTLESKIPRIGPVSARFLALLIELCRNMSKHHESLGKFPGSVALQMREGKICVISRTLGRSGDAEALVSEGRWRGGPEQASMKGLRLIYELASSLSEGGQPTIKVVVPADFLGRTAIIRGIVVEAGPKGFRKDLCRYGWHEIQLEQLNPN